MDSMEVFKLIFECKKIEIQASHIFSSPTLPAASSSFVFLHFTYICRLQILFFLLF